MTRRSPGLRQLRRERRAEGHPPTNYPWEHGNRLTKIDNPSGDDYVYEYDGDGMRVRAGHDSGQGNVWDTRFYYDTGAPLYSYLFESDNDKNMTVAYTVGPAGGLISQRRNSATYYHLYDRLGSTRQLLNSSQVTTDSYSYYAFGEIRTSSGSTANPFKFVGGLGYYDDPSTDLQYLRARYYAPAYGRFWSAEGVPETSSPSFTYAVNLPTAAVDPGGEQWEIVIAYMFYEGHEGYVFSVEARHQLDTATACGVCWHWYGNILSGEQEDASILGAVRGNLKRWAKWRKRRGLPEDTQMPPRYAQPVMTLATQLTRRKLVKKHGFVRRFGARGELYELTRRTAWCRATVPPGFEDNGNLRPWLWVPDQQKWQDCWIYKPKGRW